MPTIDVSDHVKDELDRLKELEEHRSYDSVVRMLLLQYRAGQIGLSQEAFRERLAKLTDNDPEEIKEAAEKMDIEDPQDAEWDYVE